MKLKANLHKYIKLMLLSKHCYCDNIKFELLEFFVVYLQNEENPVDLIHFGTIN